MITYGLVEVYDYRDLEQKAKYRVIDWLDQDPIQYEDDEGIKSYSYFSDMDEEEIIEHCDINEYKFDVRGNPIHHLLLTEYDPEKYKQMQEQQTETEEF